MVRHERLKGNRKSHDDLKDTVQTGILKGQGSIKPPKTYLKKGQLRLHFFFFPKRLLTDYNGPTELDHELNTNCPTKDDDFSVWSPARGTILEVVGTSRGAA